MDNEQIFEAREQALNRGDGRSPEVEVNLTVAFAHTNGSAVAAYFRSLVDGGYPEEQASWLAESLADRLWDSVLPMPSDRCPEPQRILIELDGAALAESLMSQLGSS